MGICGTDVEIASGDYGWAPPGRDRLVLGHESLGRVLDPGPATGLQTGDLVVGIVRRPDPVPCSNCAVGEWDMCRNGQYTERGIKQLDGFMSQRWRIEPELRHQARPRPSACSGFCSNRRPSWPRPGRWSLPCGRGRSGSRGPRSSPARDRSGCSPRSSACSTDSRSTCSTASRRASSPSWCATSARPITRAAWPTSPSTPTSSWSAQGWVR